MRPHIPHVYFRRKPIKNFTMKFWKNHKIFKNQLFTPYIHTCDFWSNTPLPYIFIIFSLIFFSRCHDSMHPVALRHRGSFQELMNTFNLHSAPAHRCCFQRAHFTHFVYFCIHNCVRCTCRRRCRRSLNAKLGRFGR